MLISFIPLKLDAILYEYIGLIVIDFIAIGLMFTKHYFFKFVIVLDILLILLLTINPFRDNLELRNIKPVSHKNITLKNLNALKLTRFQAHHLDFLDNNLSKSYITSSTITHSDFQFVDFSDTLIAESNMSQSKYYRVDFSHAKISDSDFSHSRFEIIDFSSATLTNVNLCHSSFLKITKDEKTTLENVQCVPQSLLP